jgi:hypothetical protein
MGEFADKVSASDSGDIGTGIGGEGSELREARRLFCGSFSPPKGGAAFIPGKVHTGQTIASRRAGIPAQ